MSTEELRSGVETILKITVWNVLHDILSVLHRFYNSYFSISVVVTVLVVVVVVVVES